MVVTNVIALMQRTFTRADLYKRTRILNTGDRVIPLDLTEWLEDQGYETEIQVNQRGEIALRGGILDVFPVNCPWPVRLEFFGDEIESIRCFDPISQMSTEQLDQVIVPPGGELGLLKRSYCQTSSPSNGSHQNLSMLVDYLPPDAIVLLSDPESLDLEAKRYSQQIPDKDPLHVEWAEVQNRLISKGVKLLRLHVGPEVEDGGVSVKEINQAFDRSKVTSNALSPDIKFTSLEAFRNFARVDLDPQIAEFQRREFFYQLHRWLREGYSVHVFCNNNGEQQRFHEIWNEYGLIAPLKPKNQPLQGSGSRKAQPTRSMMPVTQVGAITRGFLCERVRAVVVSDAEIFGRYKVQRPRRLKTPHAQASRSLLDIDFSDLQEGDYVVHVQHGIGRYLGLTCVPSGGGMKPLEKSLSTARDAQECLVIEFAAAVPDQPRPRLYVPVSEAQLVGKYVGTGKARPALHSLGGTRWRKAKEQAEHAVRDLAAELLSTQAQREALSGHSFGADTAWQREFESAFLYEETPDQLQAIRETKADLEQSKPMDRLICGDVGYGKTEVAVRAAFKVVMDGRQVALLVPTTVLAQQHFHTLRDRMADYPVRIELLSRFRTPLQQKSILQDLAAGSVDIVIGTHRLIQDDVIFKNLGLVVIDEEQRFGVLQKEKFKRMRRLIDVLTLSATPIPRTLYLALTGARDMSTIETPPLDRLPVETIVCEVDDRLIREAILRELNRQGQVFYLHNRIVDIDAVAQRLRALVPKARIVVGHGQMHADDLEEIMTRFVKGEADVLLSTTIIESGLDIPNANTIIIERADRFGLSDLYQLRGRVGRYKHQAYAYFLIPRHARMLTDARKRMSAIKQYSALGSGFKIAMRDLEIRGAGNLLGPQQSGHITAVGFDLYCQLLKQSIHQLKGDPVPRRADVQVRFDFLSLSPSDDGTGGTDNAVAGDQPAPLLRSRTSPRPKVLARKRVASDRDDSRPSSAPQGQMPAVCRGFASIPMHYIADAHQRIVLYRRLAEITEKRDIERLREEMRDRFGPLPKGVEVLLLVADLKVLASSRGISVMETKGDKLILTRQNDYVMDNGRFPRLSHWDPESKLSEIHQILSALTP
jgi:transcription-repair coupling factor (superfamily II helicase)